MLQSQQIEACPLLRSLCIHRKAPWLLHGPVHCFLGVAFVASWRKERPSLTDPCPFKITLFQHMETSYFFDSLENFDTSATRTWSCRGVQLETQQQVRGVADGSDRRVGQLCDAEAQERESWTWDETSTSGHTGAIFKMYPLKPTTFLSHENSPSSRVWFFLVLLSVGNFLEPLEASSQWFSLSWAQRTEYLLGRRRLNGCGFVAFPCCGVLACGPTYISDVATSSCIRHGCTVSAAYTGSMQCSSSIPGTKHSA